MWKVLLVEDELLIRANIKAMIDWEKNGFVICGECSDGEEAIESLADTVPDILITDIKMGKMNGDELTEYMYRYYPQVKVIIISSYSDFEYVKSTMKNQAVDYLLKYQLNPEMLLKCLKKCSDLLKKGNERYDISISLEEIRRRFVLNLIAGMYNQRPEVIPNYLKNLNMSIGSVNCIAIIMVVTEKRYEYESSDLKQQMLLETSVCNIVHEIMKKKYKGICCHMEQQRYIMLCSFENVCSWNQILISLKEFMKNISFCLKKYLNCRVKFSAGNNCRIENISQSYDIAVEQLKKGFVEDSQMLIYNDYAQPHKKEMASEILKLQEEEEKALNHAVEQENEEAAKTVLREIFERIRDNGTMLSQCIILFHELYALFIRCGKESCIQVEEIFYSRDLLDNMLIRPDISISEIENYFLEITTELFSLLKTVHVSRYSKHVENTLAIIRTRYGTPLTLNEVAGELKLNPSYLSWLFKAEIQVGFSEYLNQYRMEKARKMLEKKTYDIKEVAEKCGFGSYSYFFNLFKKRYGVTPKNYMKKSI